MSERYPDPSTKITPIAPPGAASAKASCDEYPNVVRRMDEKFEIPPFGMDPRMTQRATSQTRTSANVSRTWSRFRTAF